MLVDPSAIDTLITARRLIERPECWTIGAYNKDADGMDFVNPADAVAWCAEGAVWEACRPICGGEIVGGDALALLTEAIHNEHVPIWNDAATTTHADVLAAFDRAIAIARER